MMVIKLAPCELFDESKKELTPASMKYLAQPYQVGKFCHSLRCHLLKEHLGLLSEINATPVNIKVEDPLTSAFHSAVSKLAKGNTCIFEKVFGGRILPTNNARNLDELKDWKEINFRSC